MRDTALLHRESQSDPVPRPLRIGIVVDRIDGFENWQLGIFDRIIAEPRLSLDVLLVCPQRASTKEPTLLFSLCSRLERATLARQPAFQPKQFDLAKQRVEYVAPAQDADSHGCEHARRAVRDLDLVICMSGEGLPDAAIRQLRFGQWGFSFSVHRSGLVDWSGYRSVIEKQPSTPLSLNVQRGDPSQTVCIAESSFNTKFSAARNAGFCMERAVTLIMRELVRVADTGQVVPVDGEPKVARPEMPPSGSELLRYGLALAGNLVSRADKAIRWKLGGGSAVWTLFTGRGTIDDFDPRQAIEIEPDDDEIRADPFLLEHEGECYLFYEAYAQGQNRAHIAVSRFVGDRLERLGIALQSEHHLSYPFVFRHDGDVFMMPETNQARRIEVWRCVEFPLKWELYSTALEGQSAADSSLTWIDGKWWLFTNLSDFHAYEDHCSELHVFEVDGPALKRIVPHRRNPVVIDSTLARNAGRMFERNGKLYRPSQRNEYGVYGYGLNIMEIDQLDLDSYRETCVRTIIPDFKPDLYGCHHFDAAGGRYIIDARRDR